MPQGICYCSECGGEMELVGETPFDNDSSASSYSPDSCDTTATVDHSLISNASEAHMVDDTTTSSGELSSRDLGTHSV